MTHPPPSQTFLSTQLNNQTTQLTFNNKLPACSSIPIARDKMQSTLPSRPALAANDGPAPKPVHAYVFDGLKAVEAKQFFWMCWVDQVHALMLAKTGIINMDEARQMLAALVEIAHDGVAALDKDPTKESFLSYIEAALEKKTSPDLAKKLHTARSRIDQSATINLIYYRDDYLLIMGKVIDFQKALLLRAEQFGNSAMPYHTHMQQSQPGTFGHYLLAKFGSFNSDLQRCMDAYARMATKCPLGGVGRSGTSWPIDRSFTAELLGFNPTVENALLCRDTEWSVDMAYSLSMVMSHLNDIADDFQLWSMNEIDFIRLPEDSCSVSSIFPQKKNPLTLDVLRTKAGPSVNWVSNILSTYRCLGTGDQIGHGVSPVLAEAFATTGDALALMTKLVTDLEFKEAEALKHLAKGFSTMSNLSDFLARHHDLPVRMCYDVVKALNAECKCNNLSCAEITADMVKGNVKEFTGRDIEIAQQDVVTALDPKEFIRTRTSAGSLGPEQVRQMIETNKGTLISNTAWLNDARTGIERQQQNLGVLIRFYTN
ncbi:argininosuccinate lyase [Agrobacterium burrii]